MHDILKAMDSEWLKLQFKMHPDKTKSGLAEALGLEPPAISKTLNGNRQIKAAEYVIMRRYFGLPVDGEKALQAPKNSYLIESLNQDGFEDGEGFSDWILPASLLSERTEAQPEQVKIYQIQERVMEPEFKHGEHVLVDLSETNPSPPGVFVVSDGFGYLIRHCEFIPSSEPAEIKVSAADKSFQPQILELKEFKIIGRVIAKLQWI